MDAIILAAGRGARLRPLTDALPKPLIQIAGIRLIELHLYNLAKAGFSHVVINLHHLGQRIQDALGQGSRYGLKISYSDEADQALETAGGIRKALALIKSQQFVAISADILSDYPVLKLTQALPPSNLGHLVLVQNPKHHAKGDFALEPSRLITNALDKRYTFSGMACFDKALFDALAIEKLALRPVLEQAIAKQQLTGEVYSGLWSDIGTPERLKQARQSNGVLEYIESIKQSTN